MKVVVCFDSVRVTVPCGEGEIPVKELINKAVHRYKRAVGKGANHWVEVTNLKTISGGGILDPDDQLCDVVDDREQLIAEYDEQNRPQTATSLSLQHHHNGGDGASASSTGTTSPEPFSSHQHHILPIIPHHNAPGDSHILPIIPHHAPGDSVSSSSSSAATAPPLPSSAPPPQIPAFSRAPPLSLPLSLPVSPSSSSDHQTPKSPSAGVVEVPPPREEGTTTSNNAATDVVIVTPRDLSLGTTLRVRRGSEPNLAALADNVSSDNPQIMAGNLRSFVPRRESIRDSDEPRSESSDDEKHIIRLPMTNSLDRKKIGMARFTRDSLRSSLSSQSEMHRWLEAQQRAERKNKARQLDPGNKERMGPIEGHDGEDVNNVTQQKGCLVCLHNDGGPLGIHAVPALDKDETNIGLLIQSIEPSRPVHRDGRIQPNDTIVEINGTSLHDIPFLKAQEVFRAAMDTPDIFLKVLKGSDQVNETTDDDDGLQPPKVPAKRKPAPQPPPVMPKPRHHAPLKPSPLAAELSTSSAKSSPIPAPRDLSSKHVPEPSSSSSLSSNSTNNVDGVNNSVGGVNNTHYSSSVVVTADTTKHLSSSSTHSSTTTNSISAAATLPTSKKTSAPASSVIKPGPPIKAPKKTSGGGGTAPALPARVPNNTTTTSTSFSSSSATSSSVLPAAASSPVAAPTLPTPPTSSLLSAATDAPINAVFNTRRIGKKIVIKLRKGPAGLGFSVTSRDNQTGGDCPIYIRNILPKGAAVQDGQLRSGDRLLEVNGVEMTGKTQPEAVSFLRTLAEGSLVELVVSRQEEVDEKFKVPRKMVENSSIEGEQPPPPLLSAGRDGVVITHQPGDPQQVGGGILISAPPGLDDVESSENVVVVPPPPLPPHNPIILPTPHQHPSQSMDSIDGVVSPKETLTLRIALNDTGSAGLGVSVKGKTQSSPAGGLRDLGIFVKTVLQGGAAYKDGRLCVNDQLLEVNGIRLEGQPNTAAMESLRSAMLEEGNDGSGFITLTVLRRSPGAPLSPCQFGDVTDRPGTHSDTGVNNSLAGYRFPPNNTHNFYPGKGHNNKAVPDFDSSIGPSVIHQRSSSASDALNPGVAAMGRFGDDSINMPSPIPPARTKRVAALRERFQSESSGNGLRNDSYTRATNESMSAVSPSNKGGLRNDSYARATHDSMNDSGAFTQVQPSAAKWKHPYIQDSKENIPISNKDAYSIPSQQRPHSTIGFLHGPRASHNSVSDDDAFVRDSVASSKEESDLSPSIELVAPFAREGFGRQSMSEKRKGHLDPRSTETYKMVKAQKENNSKGAAQFLAGKERTGVVSPLPKWPPVQIPKLQPSSQDATQPSFTSSCRSASPPPPLQQAPTTFKPDVHETAHSTTERVKTNMGEQTSNIKKSSSVEDLAVPGQNAISSSSSGTNNRDSSPMWRQTRFGRARACNDSFRAAVDRSYDALDPALMDTLEEESAESGAFTLDPSNSGRSSISSDNPEDTNSLKRRKAKEKDKKGGLLKGFLRFGKGRKSNEEAMRRSRSEERPGDRALLERHQDLSDGGVGGWEAGGRPFGDAKSSGYASLSGYEQQQLPQQHQRGRRLSKPDQDRVDEEYARLRDYHASQQRLRSQSVDPSHHRHASFDNFLTQEGLGQRSSPFQPYTTSSSANVAQHQDFYSRDHPSSYDHQRAEWYTQDPRDEIDPRRFHPAATSYRQDNSQDHRGNKQYFPEMEHHEDKRPPLAKAVLSRAEYIQQLRSLYQERHRQRQGVYPLDDTEEKYERQIQEMENKGIPYTSDSAVDPSKDPHLLRFTDRPPSRQIEQHRSERTLSSSNMSNSNINSTYGRNNGGPSYSQYQYEYSSTSFSHNRPHSRGATTSAYESSRPHSRGATTSYESSRPHSRGATTAYESSGYKHYHQNVQSQQQQHRNYQHNSAIPLPHNYHHQNSQQQHHPPSHQYNSRGYNYSSSSAANLGYTEYPSPRDNNGSGPPHRQPSFTSYANDQFYHHHDRPPQTTHSRNAPSQYSQHRSNPQYTDPSSAKV